ncbi:acylneuraminate cytidylyltransferase family protein [Luminiphilus sp.]|nr:acylneuraminate cytidylyltransferase family protein [Luminiphilus sp.]
MTDPKKILCVIPARLGSKGVPKKNLADLGGKPLIAWTIEAALGCKLIDRVIVSTESREISQVAAKYGAEVPFLRPNEIASDEVHAVHVVLHALDWLKNNEKYLPHAVMMLLPTSPLRSSGDISKAIQMFFSENENAVISVCDTGKYLTNLRYLNGGKLEYIDASATRNLQRQGLEKLYAVNGSIFLMKRRDLIKSGSFHVDGARGVVMDQYASLDINEFSDLDLGRILLEKRQE